MDFVRYTDQERIGVLLLNFAGDFPPPAHDRQILKKLSNKLFNYGVVECLQIDDEKCAYAGFYCNDHESKIAYISTIATAEKYRGNGYGKSMLDRVCDISKENGMSKIRLEVRNDNTTAVNFYIRNGFAFEKKASNETQYMIKTL